MPLMEDSQADVSLSILRSIATAHPSRFMRGAFYQFGIFPYSVGLTVAHGTIQRLAIEPPSRNLRGRGEALQWDCQRGWLTAAK